MKGGNKAVRCKNQNKLFCLIGKVLKPLLDSEAEGNKKAEGNRKERMNET
jgi:hypothetical protein